MITELLEQSMKMQAAFTETQTKWTKAYNSELNAEEMLAREMLKYLRGEPTAMTHDELEEVLSITLKLIETKRTLL